MLRLRLPPAGVGAVAAVVAVLVTLLPWLRFRRFDTPSWDNAIFEQVLASYAALEVPTADVKGPGFAILGDHFSPALALLAPIYAAFPHAQTLFVLQALLLAMAVLVLGRAAEPVVGRTAAAWLSLAFGLSFGFQHGARVDFHEVALAVPLLTAAGAAYLRRDVRGVVCWSLPLLLVKEDLGATVAAIGLVLALGGARRAGLGLVATGVAAMVLIVLVVIPGFNPDGAYDYTELVTGSRWSEPGTKVATLAATIGITGFLALRSPWLLAAIPTLGWRFIGDKPAYWGLEWHYAMVLMPVVFIALLDAVQRTRAEGDPAWLRRYADHGVPVAVAIAATASLHLPVAALADPATYTRPDRAVSADRVLALVPEGSSVETDIGLITHLAGGREVYWVGTIDRVRPGKAVPVPDFVVIDQWAGGWSGPVDAVELAESHHPGHRYRQVFAEGGYEVARLVG